MKKSVCLLTVIVFFSVLESALSKDEKSHAHHQSKVQHATVKEHSKRAREKCLPQRCYIICPIPIQPIQNPIGFASPVPSPFSKVTKPPRLFNEGNEFISNELPDLFNEENQFISNELPDLFEEGRSKDNPKIKLTKRQKRILLKQLSLGNNNGKKAYSFRQFSSSFGCFVKCNNNQPVAPGPSVQIPASGYQPVSSGPSLQKPTNGIQPVSSGPSLQKPASGLKPISSGPSLQKPASGLQPVSSGTNGTTVQQGPNTSQESEGENSEEEEDEPYHEGEDKPVEVTISPPDKRSLYIQ